MEEPKEHPPFAEWNRRSFAWYKKIFSVHEIETSTVLQWFFGAALLSFLATFDAWIGSGAITIQYYERALHSCWPWLMNCGEFYFLEQLPYGHSQTMVYMMLFGVMLLAAYFMYRRDWLLAHALMLVLFTWKFLVMLLLTDQLAGNYDYYHLVFVVILLFFPLKLFFLKLTLVLFYTLSATTKFHESWILGTYFSSLQTGLPIFEDWSIPIWTNLVMVMQIVGAWFLLSSNMLLQRVAFVFFVSFHLYSGVLVEYRYPLTVLPSLIILFGLFYTTTKVPLSKRSIVGWALVAVLILLQFSSIIIPGDQRLTGEGNRYGMYMFESNHQCVSEATIFKVDGTTETLDRHSSLARNRCEVYRYWFQLQELCGRYRAEIETITWTFDHSINGGPFYRIVDVDDACALEYEAFSHNEWIKIHKDEPEVIGHPVKNVYY